VGNAENISYSGALVRVDMVMPVNTLVEVRLVLPGAGAGEHPEVACRGRVVRTIAATADHQRPAVAFAIDRYDFLRPLGATPLDADPAAHPDSQG
jgi:hypothetical protein